MAVAFCEARNEADAECERTSGDREKKNQINPNFNLNSSLPIEELERTLKP